MTSPTQRPLRPPSSPRSLSSSFYKRFINAAVAPDPETVFHVVSTATNRCIDDVGPAGLTALMWAARADDAFLVRLLLAAGASPDRRDDGGCTALAWAARAGAERALDTLLSAGATADAADALGRTPLVWAAICGRSGAAARLLAARADAARWHGNRWAPLPTAARAGDCELAATLLSAGCDANQADAGGSTALACAAYCGHVDIARLLLAQRSVDVDSRDGNGDTPLLLAALAGRVELAAALLHAGADVNGRDADGRTPLSWACCSGNSAVADELVDELLRWHASVDARDRWGRTALMWAAEEGREGAVERLLAAGADPYARDARGSTALHLAATASNGDALLRLLLRAPGPHPRPTELVDADGQTWTALAEQSRNSGWLSADCLTVLERATGAYYVRPDRVGRALVVCVDGAAAGPDEATADAVAAAAARFRLALERLGYLVDECRNPTAEEMRHTVEQFARGGGDRHGSTTAACFVTPATASDNNGGGVNEDEVGDGHRQSLLLGADDGQLPVSSVLSAFADSSCADELRGRPKLLMFHTVEQRTSRPLRRPGGDGLERGAVVGRQREPSLPPSRERHLLITFSVEGRQRNSGAGGDGGDASYASALAAEVQSAFGEFEVHRFLTAVKSRLTDLGEEIAVETRSTLDKLLFFVKQDDSATNCTVDVIDV